MVVRGMRDKGHVAPLPPLPRLYLPALVCTPRARLVLVCTPVAVPACRYRRHCCRCSCCWCLIHRLSSLVPGSRLHSHSSPLLLAGLLVHVRIRCRCCCLRCGCCCCHGCSRCAWVLCLTPPGIGLGSPKGGGDKVVSMNFYDSKQRRTCITQPPPTTSSTSAPFSNLQSSRSRP